MKRIGSILIGVALSVELCLLTDVLLAVQAVFVGQYRFAAICFGLFVVMQLFSAKYFKASAWLLLFLTLLFTVSFLGVSKLQTYRRSAEFVESMRYREADFGKDRLFKNKKVMMIVPHEDDDINVLGGVIDEYVQYGSELYVVFATNGDFYGREEAEQRINEALSLYRYLGLPEEQIVFLGYGDYLCKDGHHIYNGSEDEVFASGAGMSETYATEDHPPYREKQPFSKANILSDFKSVILDIRPDIIFCVDYDPHVDHKACSLFFEKAMGSILLDELSYSPEVYKGFGYSTAWEAEKDYFSLNIKSTQNIFDDEPTQNPMVFRWNERIRLPVKASLLSRSLVKSGLYKELSFYETQSATRKAVSIINGDKVFWNRATNSLCREADISTSSGRAEKLNDFMLLDSEKLLDEHYNPYDGTWIPEKDDLSKTVKVEFNRQESLREIVLYDNPALDSNVLNAEICFDDGTVVKTGALDPRGAASRILVEKEKVISFQIRITETEGEYAGLTEVEAFGKPESQEASFIKIVDKNGDFVYDYIIGRNGREQFSLYSDGTLPDLGYEAWRVNCDNPICQASIEDGKIVVLCPKGESCSIEIEMMENEMTDTVFIQNPSAAARALILLTQELERMEYQNNELLHFSGLKHLFLEKDAL